MQVKVDIQNCDQCPFAKVEKVYTPDSFDNIRKITCTATGKVVHKYLDWMDKGPVPKDCPYKVMEEVKRPPGTSDVEYVVISVVEGMQFVNCCFTEKEMIDTVRHFLWQGHPLVRVLGKIDLYFKSLYDFDQYLKGPDGEIDEVDKVWRQSVKNLRENPTTNKEEE